jgi:DNA-binding beta-propeller fold protein YncE
MSHNVICTAALICLFLLEGLHAATTFRHDDLTWTPDASPVDRSATASGDTCAVHGGLSVESTGIRLGTGELREPLGLDVDDRGYVYVADAMTGKVFRYTRNGESVEFGKPSRFAAFYPIDVAAFGPYIYVLDYDGNAVLRYDYRGAYLDILLSFEEYERMRPVSLTSDKGGRIVTTDIENHVLTVWSPLLDVEFSLGEYGWMEGDFNRPMKAAGMPDGRIAVADTDNKRIQIFSAAGAFEAAWAVPDSLSIRTPRYICVDRIGNIFVADTKAERIFVLTKEGGFSMTIDSFDGDSISPAACAVDWNGYLFVADLRSRSVLMYRLHYLP